MSDTIPIEKEDLAKILEDPSKFKEWFIEILETDPSKLAENIMYKLKNDEIDREMDMLLRQLGHRMPYNFIVPGLRDQLGLSIQNDKECVEQLAKFREHVDAEDQEVLDKIMAYVTDPEGELDANYPDPEIFLISLMDQLPLDNFPEIFNCIDHITAIECDEI